MYDKIHLSTQGGITRPSGHLDHDRQVIKEVVENDCYEIKRLAEEGRFYDLLVDIGSNIGTVSYMCLKHNVVGHSHAYEIDPLFSDVHERELDPTMGLRLTLHKGPADGQAICDLIKQATGQKILFKCDIEGFEYPILQNMLANGAFDHITDFVMELHDYPEFLDVAEGPVDQFGARASLPERHAWVMAFINKIEAAFKRPVVRKHFRLSDGYILGQIQSY